MAKNKVAASNNEDTASSSSSSSTDDLLKDKTSQSPSRKVEKKQKRVDSSLSKNSQKSKKTIPVVEQKVVDENEISEEDKSKHLKTRTAILLLIIIFAFSLGALLFVYYSFPNLEADEVPYVKFPRDIEDAKKLGVVLSKYKDKYFYQVLGGVFVTYLFLQTFAIPGSIFLSIISGYLFPFPVALTLICFCSATGASFCYLLSYLVGRRLVYKYLPSKAANWSSKVDKHKNNILSYIIFLRITPFLPNWFINIVSPVIDVRLKPFWLGTFIGVAPPSFVAIQAGTTLQQLTSTTEALTFQSIALLVIFAFLSILPVVLKNRKIMQNYFSDEDPEENPKNKNPKIQMTNSTNQVED